MKLTWIGHATFLLETDSGVRIVMDPVDEESGFSYSPLSADILTLSHRHHDHAATERVTGEPVLWEGEGTWSHRGVTASGISTFHDEKEGALRGNNTVFVLEADGKRLAHLGDLGHSLGEEALSKLKSLDVLLIPCGGTYTLDGVAAAKEADRIGAKLTIPMHYKTESLRFPLATVDPFSDHVQTACRVLSVGETIIL